MPNIYHNYELYLMKPFARPLSPTCRNMDKSFVYMCCTDYVLTLGSLSKPLHPTVPSTFPTVSGAAEDPRKRGREPLGRRWRRGRLQRRTLTP